MKIKHIVLATAAASALLASSSVFAIGASQGWYLAGQLGAAFNSLWSASDLATIAGAPSNAIDRSNNAFAWGINGGYNYQVAPEFLIGGQIGYQGLGSTDYTAPSFPGFDLKASLSSINFLATGTYIYQGFHAWVETGLAVGIVNPSSNAAIGNTQTQAVWVLGAGAGYQWKKWDFFVRYDHYFGDNFNASTTSVKNKFPAVNAVFGGVAYTF